ncbi:MAG TPA: hypothetical protein VGL59_17275 [Polyangia bacterium]
MSGCTRTWISLASGKGLKLGGRNAPDPSDPTSAMCDSCRDKLPKLSPMERKCDRAGCEHTWTWSVPAQLEAFATKRPAPTMLCGSCEEKLGALEDKAIPCSVEGCTRTSVFSKRAQLIAGAPDVEPTPPASMCGPCDGVFKKLKDRQVSCGIHGCKHKWLWPAQEQIQDYAAGKPNEPPRRMCDECKTVFGGVADRDVRCRTSGCKKTWSWARGDQLDACIAGKPTPKAPHRMCQSCLDIYSRLKDVERPCRRSGCKRTWTDKRGAQLARAVRGKTGDPYPHYCEECEKEMGDLDDRLVACKTDHCTGTWTWTKAQQLAAGVKPQMKEPPVEATATAVPASNGAPAAPDAPPAEGQIAAAIAPLPVQPRASATSRRRDKKRRREVRAPERRCEACIEFLKDRKTREIPCKTCGTPIYWPPESQLQTHLGNWAEPSLCGACKRDATEAARVAQREALRHPPLPGHENNHEAPAAALATAAHESAAEDGTATSSSADAPS